MLITNTSTGNRYQAVTRSNGRYNAENVAVGGPYVTTGGQSGPGAPHLIVREAEATLPAFHAHHAAGRHRRPLAHSLPRSVGAAA